MVQDITLMQLVDIGINLAHESYDIDRAQVIRRALEAGVVQMVITGSSVASTEKAVELAREAPHRLRATAGCHPHHAVDLDASALERIRAAARLSEVSAIGECGLDYFRDFSPRAVQREAFARQLELAAALGKPVFLHQREAHADFVAILREHRPRLAGGVAHCFTDGRREAEDYLSLDLHIGITGWICDERRGKHLLDVVPHIPAGRLMIETDGPYLLPRNLQPRPATRRNEPKWLPWIARTIADARGESLETLAAHTTAAARAFFRLPEL